MRYTSCVLALFCSLAFAASAQQATPPQAFGTVIGHVYCSGINAPARLATVTLQPIKDLTDPPAESRDHPAPPTVYAPVQTSLDGSFTMPKVAPGYYYVVVQYSGYLSPVSQLTRDDLAHPTPDMLKFIASVLPSISIEANRVTTTDIHLQRGASISGTIRFDDGSPAPDLYVSILRKDEKGHWIQIPASRAASSDDQGRYRVVGLPAGDYILKASLELSERFTSYLFSSVGNSGGSSSSSTRYSLSIYSGGKTRQSDARDIKLNDGEDDSGEDILIPVSKLHSVTGNIVEARTGRVINAGAVVLLYPDDKSQAASAKVDKDDSSFHFDFVPEGNYILRVTSARDVTREEISNGRYSFPPTHTKETTIRTYGPHEQSIIVTGDMTGVIVPVTDQATTPKVTR